jgi:hypothetical protein
MTLKKTTTKSNDEITQALEGLSTVEAIALKFWWGWVPLTRQRKWIVPGFFNQRLANMNQEERQWFQSH